MNVISVNRAVKVLNSGGVIAYPTEAVYGLGCDPFNEAAFSHLLALKCRPIEKGVILIASSIDQIKDLVKIENQLWTETVLKSWGLSSYSDFNIVDRPMTWVLPISDKVPTWITGGRDTLAVRITRHPAVVNLCEALKMPLVSTSANLTGDSPVKTAKECGDIFPNTLILEGEVSGLNSPSQIWDAVSLQRLR